jgi:hypothetical protein
MTIIRRPPKYVQAWMDKEGRPYFYLRRPAIHV